MRNRGINGVVGFALSLGIKKHADNAVSCSMLILFFNGKNMLLISKKQIFLLEKHTICHFFLYICLLYRR